MGTELAWIGWTLVGEKVIELCADGYGLIQTNEALKQQDKQHNDRMNELKAQGEATEARLRKAEEEERRKQQDINNRYNKMKGTLTTGDSSGVDSSKLLNNNQRIQ